jgi:hypothetical protein
LKELLKITYNGKEEIIDRINSTLRDLTIDCPECEGMEDDQYTCTTCWCEGGDGKIRVSEYIVIK